MALNQYEQKALELKYRGSTYREISKAIGGKLTEKTLETYFSVEGKLWLPYQEYCASLNAFSEDEIRKDFKRGAQYAYKIKQIILQKALAKGDYVLANRVASDILDRAGLVIVRKAEINVDNKIQETPIETYEQYASKLRGIGIDPRTGFRLAPTGSQES